MLISNCVNTMLISTLSLCGRVLSENNVGCRWGDTECSCQPHTHLHFSFLLQHSVLQSLPANLKACVNCSNFVTSMYNWGGGEYFCGLEFNWLENWLFLRISTSLYHSAITTVNLVIFNIFTVPLYNYIAVWL